MTVNHDVTGSSPVWGAIFLFGGIPERPKGTDCKSVGSAFEGSNPSPSTFFYRGMEQLVARRAHNPKAGGSSPPPATNLLV